VQGFTYWAPLEMPLIFITVLHEILNTQMSY
jgi:hypothetical protein